jgi:hypothetical protein
MALDPRAVGDHLGRPRGDIERIGGGVVEVNRGYGHAQDSSEVPARWQRVVRCFPSAVTTHPALTA